jgi:hypothetical protein
MTASSYIGFYFLLREILKGGIHTGKSRKRLNNLKSSPDSAYTDLLLYSTHPLYANIALMGHERGYTPKMSLKNKSNTKTQNKPNTKTKNKPNTKNKANSKTKKKN